MPIVDGKYVSPEWENNKKPGLSADELNAIGQTLQFLQENGDLPVVDGVPADAEPGDAWINTQEGVGEGAQFVASFNGRTGAVLPQTGDYDSDMVGLGNVDNVKQYSEQNPPPYPVLSVNGQTGAITLSSGAQVETVEYTGTGTAGSANPTSITFSFAPKWLVKLGYKDNNNKSVFYSTVGGPYDLGSLTTSYQLATYGPFSGGTNPQIKRSADGKTISWYDGSSNSSYQQNYSGFKYRWGGIG